MSKLVLVLALSLSAVTAHAAPVKGDRVVRRMTRRVASGSTPAMEILGASQGRLTKVGQANSDIRIDKDTGEVRDLGHFPDSPAVETRHTRAATLATSGADQLNHSRWLHGSAINTFALEGVTPGHPTTIELAIPASGHVSTRRQLGDADRAERLAFARRFAQTNRYQIEVEYADGRREQLAPIKSTGLVTRASVPIQAVPGRVQLHMSVVGDEGFTWPGAYPQGRTVEVQVKAP